MEKQKWTSTPLVPTLSSEWSLKAEKEVTEVTLQMQAVMVSHLNLVDLAGSDTTSQTGSEGVQLKEDCNINWSMFILGQVIKSDVR